MSDLIIIAEMLETVLLDESMRERVLLAVLAVDNDWAHCIYYGEKGETKDGWFRTEMLKEVN